MNNQEKICYAVMPYGGEKQEMVDHFELVFQLFIKNPAEELGYKVIREDHLGQPGSIIRNVIHHLAEGELVIADMSSLNWNVAYELGIRHALVKGGTVLLCDDEIELPFDVSNLQAVLYNHKNPIGNLKSVQDAVKQAILHRESKPAVSDNSVHDIYPFEDFSVSYLGGGDADAGRQLQELTEALEKLRQENALLRERLEQGGISVDIDNEQPIDIAASVERALSSIEYSGKNLIYALRDELEENPPDYNKIGEILKAGLSEGYLDESDFRSLYFIFKKAVPQLTELILEVAAQRYPASLDFKSYLADMYSDRYQTRDKALRYANEVLQVSVENDVYTTACNRIDSDQLGACMNAYIGLGRFDIIIQVVTQLLQQVPMHRELLLRNLTVAYRETGNTQKEKEILTQLLDEYPMSDVNHYRVSRYYINARNYEQAYYQMELSAALDSGDADYMFAIAGLILDECIARTGTSGCTKIGRQDSALYAVPFVMRALTISTTQSMLVRCREFLLRNHIKSYDEEFDVWVNAGLPDHGIEGLQYEALDYVDFLGKNIDYDDMRYRAFELHPEENGQNG